jgi:hypothetical protein
MKSLLPILMAALFAMVLGCKEGTPGGPGAKSNPPSSSSTTASRTTTVETPDGSSTTKVEVQKPAITDPNATEKPALPGTDANPIAGDPENSFRLDAPNLATTVKQGETKVVTIGISRSKNFDQDVTLMFEGVPKGVTIDPAEPVIKRGDKEVKLNVTAAGDASLNSFTIKMTGHPATGKDAANEFKLTVQMP